MTERFAETLQMENKLRRALELGQFVLHYQPKLHAITGRVTGVEALIRWNDPETGLVPPGRFIPLLESTGMILAVGDWAIEQGCATAAAVSQGEPSLSVAVNVSAIQLRRDDFVPIVEAALARFPGARLELEITESLIMQDIDANIRRLSSFATWA
jgi:EAL domain-containing protein (putative c-di-GMP-specific phosphodiesterase class I)